MPHDSDQDNVTPLTHLEFTHANSVRAEFAFPDAGLALHVEAHAPGVYRIRCAPSNILATREEKPTARQKAHAEMLLARDEPVGELATSSVLGANGWRLEQGDVVLEIALEPLRFTLYRGESCVWRSAAADFLQKGERNDEALWCLSTQLEEDDYLHGLGENTGDLDRRGCTIVSDDPEARAASLLWSTRGWGLYVNTLGRIEYDLGATHTDICQHVVHDAVLDFFLFAGEPTEILNQHSALTGRAGQPGLAPMGVWLEQAPGASLDETLAIIENFRANEWSVDTLELATPAVYGFQSDKPVFEWDANRCGDDQREFHARLQAANVQLAAPTLPAVLEGTELFEEWEDRGWLLIRDEDGSACVFPGNEFTNGQPYGLLDLTNKDVYKLWVERQRQAVDEGLASPVCNVQTDIPDDVTARGGECGAVLRTIYPLLARRALFDAVAGHRTPQEGVVVSTDLFPAVQRSTWQAGPRCDNTWDGLAHSLRNALALGDSGVPVQTHRLGNALRPLDEMTPELYIRWLANCVLSANFSFQGVPGLLPSAFDEATQELVRHWLQWRYRLIPYVLGIIEDSVRTGLPVQRSMALCFPSDPVAQAWDTQYMFGPALLVAPMLEPGTKARVYLPEGQGWWDMNTGWRYEGGTVLEVECGLDTLPIFGREGQMLCLGPGGLHTGDFNSARPLDEVWMFGMPEHSPVVMRNKIRVMQMQGSSYIKGLEGLKILPSEGLEVKRRGAEVRISRAR
ncbi:glycoside hydrolase family 31 protein [Achromobacter sp. F4_2707]|uniref:glycoside hydrolase family 31 protein n=1 Tax=Achromobacter sp. F4_2707 TaxID=3114286 RepID=UPI0039C61822